MSAGGQGGASAAAQAAQRAGVALASEVAADFLEVAGADRVRFLHNLTTCDVRALAPGGSVRGFLTDVRGHVLADADVVALADRLRLRLPAGRAAAIAAHLARYRIADRVEIAAVADLVVAELRGPGAPGLLEALLAAPPPRAGAHAAVALGGAAVLLRARPLGRAPRFELAAAPAALAAALAALRGAGAARGLLEPGLDALEAVRIEDGELAWGVDYGEESFPQETGEEGAVSPTKGCYLGQEVVARIHYRGQVQRVARGLVFEAGARAAPGEELLAGDGRPAGRATSVADSCALGRAVALSLVARRAAEPGARLTTAAGAAAEVRALPLL